ncbi:MAG: Lrp/AsnC family transcriptional regulator, partial [Candidatus Thorarchaeota archaeon]
AILAFFINNPIGNMLALSIILLGIVVTAYNKRVKPKKRAARASLENQLQMFRDLETLRHFMAVYLDRGTCVFYHPFTDERIQPDLISGFIAAITSVYGEIKGDGVRGTLEEIQYHGLRLNSYSGEFIIGILILEGEMTPLLKDRLQFFVELFENQYDSELTEWNGLIDCFDPEWIVSTLSSAFNYSWLLAHRFGPTQKVAKTETKILDYISAVRDDRSEFYFRDLLTPLAEMLGVSEAAILDRLLALQDRGVIAPVSIQTILQRQGMGLANGEIGADDIKLEYPDLVEPVVDEPEDSDEEPSSKQDVEAEPEPEEETPESDIADDFVKEVESLMSEEPEEKKEELDPMDEFVQDVESLLTKEKDEDENE